MVNAKNRNNNGSHNKSNKRRKRTDKNNQHDDAHPSASLSLTPLYVFLAIAVAVVAYTALAPLETSYEKAQSALVRAQMAFRKEEWERSVKEMDNAQRLGVGLTDKQLNNYGICLMKQNRTKEAAGMFRKAVASQVSFVSDVRQRKKQK